VFSDLEYMGSIYPTVVKIEGVKILIYFLHLLLLMCSPTSSTWAASTPQW